MQIASWNLSGVGTYERNDFNAFVTVEEADIYCFQEIKANGKSLGWNHPGFYVCFNCGDEPDFSGTLTATSFKPNDVIVDLPDEKLQGEGRLIVCEYNNFYLVNCFAPYIGKRCARIGYRTRWETCFRKTLRGLDKIKPVICCGDLSVCHQSIDIYLSTESKVLPGYSEFERESFSMLLDAGFVDVWRTLHPDTVAYTRWDPKDDKDAREKNLGRRCDYFLVSKRLMPRVNSCITMPDVYGSDHCPIMLDIEL